MTFLHFFRHSDTFSNNAMSFNLIQCKGITVYINHIKKKIKKLKLFIHLANLQLRGHEN